MTSVAERLSAVERDVAELKAGLFSHAVDPDATPAGRRVLRRLERIEREVQGLVRWASGGGRQ